MNKSEQPLDYDKLLEDLVEWTRTAMKNAGGSKAILGISGGKDSSVCAALMVKVLGKENVIGVLMPDGQQGDMDFSLGIVEHLGIPHHVINIFPMTKAFHGAITTSVGEVSKQSKLNIPPRVRMTLLYGLSQSIEGSRVINTSNLSEDWVGYATIYGDTAGAFSPFGMLTTEEVIELGRRLNVPEQYLVKPPSDGLTGKTDEDVLGVTYPAINAYIRQGIASEEDLATISRLHRLSRFKFLPLPMFNPHLPILGDDIAKVYEK